MPDPISSNATEWSLLLSACSATLCPERTGAISPRLQKPIQWPVLVALADRHGVSSLFNQALQTFQDQVPADQIHVLADRYQSNIHKSLFLARELIRILDCFDSRSLEVMPYKGVTLAETMYGDMALRHSGDIDLLIRPTDVKRAQAALHDLGYTPQLSLSPQQENAYLSSGYECAFDSDRGRNLLELQWALQPRFYAVDVAMDELFKRAVFATVAGRRMKTLSPEDMMLVLSVHAAKHVWGRLIWLCDIAQVIRRSKLDWNWIETRAGELGVLRIVQITLLLAHQLLKADLPAPVTKNLSSDPATVALADEIHTQVAAGTSLDVESFAYFSLMIRLRERRADKMRFVHRLAFTPGPNEWQAIQLPPLLFPLYRLVRVARLTARFARV